ncbi:MAG TPA: sialidase family protein [Acidimicrobiia bacterium]|nr:sialidase family protein [Acidimicrobiia bacterium]
MKTAILVGMFAAGLALGYVAFTLDGGRLVANPIVAVRGVAPDATNDNGQSKLARATDGTLYLAYSAPVDGVEQAHISFSLDDGQTWKPEITLGQPGIWSDLPSIATGPDGRLDVAWVDYVSVGHVWYASKQDGVWSEQVKISPGPDYAGFPAVVVSDDTAHLVWYAAKPSEETEHGSLYQIVHTSNTDGSWSPTEILSTSSDDALNPALTHTADGNLQAAWFQIQGDVYGAQVATFSGGDWTTPDLVSVPGVRATGVAITADANGVTHMVWEQSSQNSTGVAYARQVDGVWGPVEELSTGDSADPVVAVDDAGRTYVVWSQGGQITARVRDGDWSDPVTLGDGTNPTLLSGETVLAAWSRPSDAGNELVTSQVAVSETTQAPRIALGTIAVTLIVGGLVLGWQWRQLAAETPEMESTDRTSGK